MQQRPRLGRRVARAALAILVVAPALSCTLPHSFPRYGRHYHLSPGAHGRAVERALLVPVNLVPDLHVGLVGHTSKVSDAIAEYLASHGIEVAETEERLARELWTESLEETRPVGGEPDPGSAAVALVRRLREREVFDVLVVPTLLYREGRLQAGRVRWDGVVRELPVADSADPRTPIRRETGDVAALSLHVIVFDETGKEHFHGVGGLSVAQTAVYLASRRGWFLRHREDPFEERGELREGVELAFEPYLEPEDASPPRVGALRESGAR